MPDARRIAGLVLLSALAACSQGAGDPVVVYTSVDEIYSREIFAAFTRDTGIGVKAVYDTEEAKSLGLAMRIVAERGAPQADVFWNGEPSRTVMLKREGVLAGCGPATAQGIGAEWRDPGDHWIGFAARARVIVYNTKKVTEPPKTIDELATPAWRGRVAMANPRFGTTAAHVAAIAQERGEEGALKLLAALKTNGVRIVGGNSHVRDLVARGECDAGLTDSDDGVVMAVRHRTLPLEAVQFHPESVLTADGQAMLRNFLSEGAR